MISFIGSDQNLFAERMLENGFYPENVPPSFWVENLHELYLRYQSPHDYISTVATEHTRFNSSKRNRQRRIFSVSNPIFILDCIKFFLERAEEIEEHFSISDDSCSKPVFSAEGSRALKIDSFGEFYLKRRDRFADSRYIVKCDISRFYHSIYTHCIPWALHGKLTAKSDRKTDSKNVFGNRLDFILRQAQDGQTVGIPVGPDVSRIISEIIAIRIDSMFRMNAGPETPMLRLVDDIYIGADDQDEAHRLLGLMREAIRNLELDVNDAKTVVLDASRDVESPWPAHIRQKLDNFSHFKKSLETELIYAIDEIVSMSFSNNDDGVIRYALRIIDNDVIWFKYWGAIEPFLIRCCISFPHSIDYVAQIVAAKLKFGGINTARWEHVLNKSIKQNADYGHDFEVSWALWLINKLNVRVDKVVFESIFEKCGSLPMIAALDVHKRGNVDAKPPKEKILERIGQKPMLGPHWILAYEGDRQFGLKIKTKNIQGHELFRELYDDNVSFYAAPEKLLDGDDTSSVPDGPVIKSTSSYDESTDRCIDDDEDDY